MSVQCMFVRQQTCNPLHNDARDWRLPGHSVGPLGRRTPMSRITRTIAATVAALTVSLGLLDVATPAHASPDTSWGYVYSPGPAR